MTSTYQGKEHSIHTCITISNKISKNLLNYFSHVCRHVPADFPQGKENSLVVSSLALFSANNFKYP